MERPAHGRAGRSHLPQDEDESDGIHRAKLETETLRKFQSVRGMVVIGAPDFWIKFVLASLATWRVTHLLAREDGPADLIVRLRTRLGSGLAGTLMDCFKCLSLWIAAPAALFVTRNLLDWLFTWLALSGAACLWVRLGQEPVEIQPVSEPIEGDTSHVLRPETIDYAEPLNASEALGPSEAAGLSPGQRNKQL